MKPAMRESRLVMIQLEPRARRNYYYRHKGTRQRIDMRCQHKVHLFQVFWKHVSVGKSLMTAHSHDIGLNVRRKRSNVIGKDLTMFLPSVQ